MCCTGFRVNPIIIPHKPSTLKHGHDVQSCAVDPGAVRSSIWKRAGPIMQWVANHLFAPNEDGCQTVIHAATDAWEPVPQPTDTNQQPSNLRVS